MISIFNTFIHPDAQTKVAEVLSSGMLSEGKLVREFEQRLAGELGLVNPVAVNSGSSALQLALMVAGVSDGHEVILPAQTFVASALAVLKERARPVFCDIEYDTGNMDPLDLEHRITERTKAVMPVHWAGYPCNIDGIKAIAARHKLVVIEDAAHALGATYKDKPIGSISDYTCFSFQAIKHLTTGDGGAVCCMDAASANEAMARRWFGIDRASAKPALLGERQYDLTVLGFKYHLNDYAAALGLANLNGMSERLASRRAVADYYRQSLKDVSGIKLFRRERECLSAYWLFGMHIEKREDFVRALASRGVMASVVHQRIDRNTIFGGLRNDLPSQCRFDSTQINIPIHDAVDLEVAETVVAAIKAGW